MEDTIAGAINSAKLDELRELFGQEGAGEFERFLGVYVSSSEQGLAGLRAAVLACDAAGIARCAHLLKGSSGNIGADRFADACRSLEESARRGLKGDCDSVEAEFRRVRAAIEALMLAACPQAAGKVA